MRAGRFCTGWSSFTQISNAGTRPRRALTHITPPRVAQLGQGAVRKDKRRTCSVTNSPVNPAHRASWDRWRFPEAFMFRLSAAEGAALKIANCDIKGRDGRRKVPWAFTERGAIQVANVANSPRAINLAVQVLRAFVRLRDILASNKDQNAPTTKL